MYKHETRGTVLLAVLVFMSLISFIGMHALNVSLNAIKVNEHLWQHRKAFYAAHQALSTIEKQLVTDYAVCKVSWIAAGEIAKKPMSWWRHRCSGNLAGIRYYYCLELLAKEPCARGKSNDQSLFNAAFYRISVLALPNLNGAKLIVQSVVVKAQQGDNICTEQPRIVRLGRQMWRTF